MKHGALVLAAALAGGIFAACAASESEVEGPLDGGLDDATFGGDVAPASDAEPPLGDICGDSAGLQKGAPWPMRGGCPKRAGVSASTGPGDSVIRWSFPVAAAASSPVMDASRLVWIGTADGDLIAVTTKGTVQSVFHTAGAVRSSAAVDAQGRVLFTGTDGMFYGVAPALVGDGGVGDAEAGVPDARLLSSTSIGASASSALVAGDGVAYVVTNGGKLEAITADRGAIKWAVPIGDTGAACATLGPNGTIYVGSADHKVYALDSNGTIRWTFETGGPIAAPVTVGGDDVVYAGSTDGTLYALAVDGKSKWSYPTGGPIHGSPAVRAGAVYVGSDDKRLHSVNAVTGAGRWTFATLGAVATPVIGTDGTVYVGSTDGKVYAVTPGGSLFFATNTKGAITSAPAIGQDGTLYVTTSNALVAIGR